MRSLRPLGAGIDLATVASTMSSTLSRVSQITRDFGLGSTLIGFLSTGIPLHSATAFTALSDRTKVMFAIPRLTPPGPYESSTLLTGPMVLAKYSYCSKGLISDLGIDYVMGIVHREVEARYEMKHNHNRTVAKKAKAPQQRASSQHC
jgi:hypothetical protein